VDLLANLFKALSDETRLRILALLRLGGELCVCDVEGVLGITQSKSSRHLRYLLNAGLVQNRREAAWVFYRLPDAPGPAQADLLAGLERWIAGDSQARLAARLEDWLARKRDALSRCCAG
jgi:DNA-binding transcriptional ArsR family regulator